MNHYRIELLLRAGRWLRAGFVNGGLILLYHRVTQDPNSVGANPYNLSVSTQRFAEHLAVIRQIGNPLSLSEMVLALKTEKLPERAIAITFDDGYADNLYHAKPLLEHFSIPATVFVTAGSLGKTFWWDELGEYIFRPAALPADLNLMINSHHKKWKIRRGSTNYRRRLLHLLHKDLRSLNQDKRKKKLLQISAWVGITPEELTAQRALTTQEVTQLAEGDLIEIGAHTINHVPLANMSMSQQRYEIEGSRKILGELLGQPVTSFSYPFGLPTDYTDETNSIVQEAGYQFACSNYVDIAWKGSDLFQLPRYGVRDWTGPELATRIKSWLRN